jgi:hypothetical protein
MSKQGPEILQENQKMLEEISQLRILNKIYSDQNKRLNNELLIRDARLEQFVQWKLELDELLKINVGNEPDLLMLQSASRDVSNKIGLILCGKNEA